MPSIHVYVKKLKAGEFWHPVLMLPPNKTAEQVIEEDKKVMRKFAILQGNSDAEAVDQPEILKHEIICYHYTFKPHETADLYYEWLEETV